jgi:tetratricopeptide (TPR) repeat protein
MTSRFLTGCSSKVGFSDSEVVVTPGGSLREIIASHLAQTVHSRDLFIKLTNELIQFAEEACVMRNVDALDEVSHVLMNLPVHAAREIGIYYYALIINRKGHTDEAKTFLETVADNAPITYRARAIQTLGGIHHDLGQLDEALRLQLEALRLASDRNAHGLQTTLMAHHEISVIKSLDGDHKGALSSLRSFGPLVNLVSKQKPFYFYVYCSELAIELGELGRLAEAEATLEVALASPYAPAYPNWTETRQELEAKRRSARPSVVAVNRAPEAVPSPQTKPQRKSKPVARLTFSWPAYEKTSLQRASKGNAVTAAIPIDGTTQSILDRVLICIGSRAPPASS